VSRTVRASWARERHLLLICRGILLRLRIPCKVRKVRSTRPATGFLVLPGASWCVVVRRGAGLMLHGWLSPSCTSGISSGLCLNKFAAANALPSQRPVRSLLHSKHCSQRRLLTPCSTLARCCLCCLCWPAALRLLLFLLCLFLRPPPSAAAAASPHSLSLASCTRHRQSRAPFAPFAIHPSSLWDRPPPWSIAR
jgi:hypothetical protein